MENSRRTSKCLFSPSAGSRKGSPHPCPHSWNLRWLLGENFTKLWGTKLLRLGPLGVFNSQTYPHRAPKRLSIRVQVFLLWHWFQQRFLLLGSCHSLYPSVCSVGLRDLPCDLHSLKKLRKLFFFSLFSFVLVDWERWPPSSLHVRKETRVPPQLYILFFVPNFPKPEIFPSRSFGPKSVNQKKSMGMKSLNWTNWVNHKAGTKHKNCLSLLEVFYFQTIPLRIALTFQTPLLTMGNANTEHSIMIRSTGSTNRAVVYGCLLGRRLNCPIL